MDSVAALLAEARAAGLSLKIDGERLLVRGPKAAGPIVERLREAKPAILDRLRTVPTPDASAPLTRSDAFTENEFIARAHGGISGKTRQDASAAPMRQPAALPRLDPETVREVLGERPDPHVLAMIAFGVLDAVRALEREIQSGTIAPGPRLVEGRPLGDWLDLGDVARLLRAWRDRRPA